MSVKKTKQAIGVYVKRFPRTSASFIHTHVGGDLIKLYSEESSQVRWKHWSFQSVMRIFLERKTVGRCLTIFNVLKSNSGCGSEHDEAKIFEMEQ